MNSAQSVREKCKSFIQIVWTERWENPKPTAVFSTWNVVIHPPCSPKPEYFPSFFERSLTFLTAVYDCLIVHKLYDRQSNIFSVHWGAAWLFTELFQHLNRCAVNGGNFQQSSVFDQTRRKNFYKRIGCFFSITQLCKIRIIQFYSVHGIKT